MVACLQSKGSLFFVNLYLTVARLVEMMGRGGELTYRAGDESVY